jgi:hypothetical protein
VAERELETQADKANRRLQLEDIRIEAKAMRDKARRAYDAGSSVEISPIDFIGLSWLVEACVEVLDRHGLQPEVGRAMMARADKVRMITPEEARRD